MAKTKNPYSVHPAVSTLRKAFEGLKGKTGRDMREWVDLAKAAGPSGEKERREWLKSEHGLTTNYAWWIAEHAEGKGETGDPDDYLKSAVDHVEAMFAGKRASLRPVYNELLKLAFSLGKDVKACPCKTIVPLYREHVFANIKPSTLTRIDLGFALRHTPASGRLIDTGGFAKKDRITHRIPITSLAEINDEVCYWLRTAYDLDA